MWHWGVLTGPRAPFLNIGQYWWRVIITGKSVFTLAHYSVNGLQADGQATTLWPEQPTDPLGGVWRTQKLALLSRIQIHQRFPRLSLMVRISFSRFIFYQEFSFFRVPPSRFILLHFPSQLSSDIVWCVCHKRRARPLLVTWSVAFHPDMTLLTRLDRTPCTPPRVHSRVLTSVRTWKTL